MWRFFDLMLVKLFPLQTFWMTFCLFGWDKIKISKCSWSCCCWWFNGDWIPTLFSTLLQFPPLNYHGHSCHILLVTLHWSNRFIKLFGYCYHFHDDPKWSLLNGGHCIMLNRLSLRLRLVESRRANTRITILGWFYVIYLGFPSFFWPLNSHNTK